MLQGRRFDAIAEGDFVRLGEVARLSDLGGKTVLLTGATGFFGAWLLAYLGWLGTACEQAVRVFAASRDPGAFLKRHPWAKDASWLHWIEGDIRTFEFPDARIDAVLHAATDTSAAAGQAANQMLDSVILGTRRVLDCAARANAGRVLLVSSGAVYGAQPLDLPLTTEDSRLAPSPLDPNNVYAEAKRVMEMLGAIHARDHGAAVMSARCFAFVGAGLPLDGHFAIGNFIRDALTRESITVRGGGQAVRSYLYAADLAIWLTRILTRGKVGNAYNVGSDHAITIADLAHEVARTLSPNKPVHIEGRDGASPVGNRFVPSVARCRSELGLDVWTDLPTAVAHTAQWRVAHSA
jgi:nucleoside-diphosphate-sugar epimerase